MRPKKNVQEILVGGKELVILQVIYRLKGQAYGALIYRELKEQNNKTALPQIYACLKRLEGKGLIETSTSAPLHERGGRRRQLYNISGAGQSILNTSLSAKITKSKEGVASFPKNSGVVTTSVIAV